MSGKQNDLTFLRNALGLTENEDDGGVWNIFVQILLPLVLILTFVAVVDIMKYKDIAKQEKEGRMLAVEELEIEKNNNKPLEQKNTALISLQLQKLLVSLEKVKKEEIRKLKINVFPDARRIGLNGTHVTDDDFKFLCLSSAGIFTDDNAEQKKKDAIYIAVIEGVEGLDDSEMKEKKSSGLPIVEKHNPIPEDDPYMIDKTEITKANRMKIHNEIIAFVGDIKNTVIHLQTALLHRIFEYLLENPGTLDDNLREMVDNMNKTHDNTKKKELAKIFYMSVMDDLQKRIEETGLTFQRETWNNLKILDTGQKVEESRGGRP